MNKIVKLLLLLAITNNNFASQKEQLITSEHLSFLEKQRERLNLMGELITSECAEQKKVYKLGPDMGNGHSMLELRSAGIAHILLNAPLSKMLLSQPNNRHVFCSYIDDTLASLEDRIRLSSKNPKIQEIQKVFNNLKKVVEIEKALIMSCPSSHEILRNLQRVIDTIDSGLYTI